MHLLLVSGAMTTRKRSAVHAPGGITTINVVGGAQGLGMDLGRETEDVVVSATQTRDLGSESESFVFTSSPSIAIGTETETDVVTTATGAGTTSIGTESEDQAFSATQTRDLGSESEALSADATAVLSKFTTTATAVLNEGTTNWANPTNAQGAINGTEASLSFAPVTETIDSATLICSGLIVTSTPSGFTRTAAGIRIVHRWDLTLTGAIPDVIDAFHTIDLYDSADVFIATLNQRTASGGGGTQATLLTEDYDITSLVSDAQLSAGVKVYCSGDYFFTAVNGNASWQVDAVHLRATYVRTGIT